MRFNVPQANKPTKSCKHTDSESRQAPQEPSGSPRGKISTPRAANISGQTISAAAQQDRPRRGVVKFNRQRAALVISKIDEIIAWDERFERERDIRFLELGRYLCEVRAGQYWRVDHLNSFDEFLEKKFPESRRKAYDLMAIHEQLPRELHRNLTTIGWTKATELVKVARRDGRKFQSASWMHKASTMPRGAFKTEVQRHLTGKDVEPSDTISFEVRKSQLPVIEQAIEAASVVLGQRKSRGSCLEFVCADFIASKNSELTNPGALANLVRRLFELLPAGEKHDLLDALRTCA